jgi:hypothetical protein
MEHELHAQALPIAERMFARKREHASRRCRELAQTPRSSARLDVILPAAIEGRVETLFIDRHAVDLGTFNPTTGFISYGRRKDLEVEDLLDRAAVEGLLHHAEVYAVPRAEMPCDSAAAAILRY